VLGFKAGIGTASRILELGRQDDLAPVGVLVQANFSGLLTVLGVPVGEQDALRELQGGLPGRAAAAGDDGAKQQGNSCVVVVAIDAALDARQLGRIARRAVYGLARVGSDFAEGSGDSALAFSVAAAPGLSDAELDPLFVAVQESLEEAVLNSMFMARTTIGFRHHIKYAVPLHYVTRVCATRSVLSGGSYR
jgi:D-aminopeptidase